MIHNNLPLKYYFINNFNTKNLKKLKSDTAIIYRNYLSKDCEKSLLILKHFCKKNNLKFFISNNIELAIKLDLDGAYIPSFNTNFKHLSYSLKNKFLLIGSAHNNKEIKKKEKQGIELVFLSSIFKKNKNFLGINKFKKLCSYTNLNIIALGGINKSNKKKLKLTKCKGFAGISFFK
jgi:thiamine-phosphate pyrophosphorylase